MSKYTKNRNASQFIMLSTFFWALILLVTVLWKPVYFLMAQFITMDSEYSLVEQGSKLLLLFMMLVSLVVYRNEEDRAKILLGLTFLLFAIAMYFSESNFIENAWQPLFGAVFIIAIAWQLFKTDIIALLFMLFGCAAIVMGMLGDTWKDHPEVLIDSMLVFHMGRIAYSLEEHLEFWGVAFLAYANLFVFRDILSELFHKNRLSMTVLILSSVFIASGNSFAHWHYPHSQIMLSTATLIAFLGLLGIVLVSERLLNDDIQLGFFNKGVFYYQCVLIFLILPVIYGWYHGGVLNLVMWVCFFIFAGGYLYKSNPRLYDKLEMSAMSEISR